MTLEKSLFLTPCDALLMKVLKISFWHFYNLMFFCASVSSLKRATGLKYCMDLSDFLLQLWTASTSYTA